MKLKFEVMGMNCKLGVIGVGNMAKAIIGGIQGSSVAVSQIFLYDKNTDQYDDVNDTRVPCTPMTELAKTVALSDCILLSVKPQNFPEVLAEIAAVSGHERKLYITIAAGITVDTVSSALNGARVVRALPNLPMTIGRGVSVICRNSDVDAESFDFIKALFESSGSSIVIDECEMNRMIGVTSSSPAYVFAFIDAMYNAALAQGLSSEGLISAICDVFIGSAELLKRSDSTPGELASRVASKGGTTERALAEFKASDLNGAVLSAMNACTARADELSISK